MVFFAVIVNKDPNNTISLAYVEEAFYNSSSGEYMFTTRNTTYISTGDDNPSGGGK